MGSFVGAEVHGFAVIKSGCPVAWSVEENQVTFEFGQDGDDLVMMFEDDEILAKVWLAAASALAKCKRNVERMKVNEPPEQQDQESAEADDERESA